MKTTNAAQVLEMSKQQQTKKEVKEMAIPISLGGGAKQGSNSIDKPKLFS